MTGLPNVFHGVWNKLKDVFTTADHQLSEFLKPIEPQLKAAGAAALQLITHAGLSAVQDAAKTNTNIESLLDVAFDAVKDSAKVNAPVLGATAINLIGTAIISHLEDAAGALGTTISSAANAAAPLPSPTA